MSSSSSLEQHRNPAQKFLQILPPRFREPQKLKADFDRWTSKQPIPIEAIISGLAGTVQVHMSSFEPLHCRMCSVIHTTLKVSWLTLVMLGTRNRRDAWFWSMLKILGEFVPIAGWGYGLCDGELCEAGCTRDGASSCQSGPESRSVAVLLLFAEFEVWKLGLGISESD